MMTGRERRVRRFVPYDAVNRDVLDYALAYGPEPAAPSFKARMAAMEAGHTVKRKARPASLEAVWRRTITERTGCAVSPWTGRERGRMDHAVRTIPLPDPAVTWSDVVEWVAGDWGEAVSLSIPFMIHAKRESEDGCGHWEDKRADILEAMPSLSLFFAYADCFADAFAALRHGRGFRARELERAEADQATHAAYMAQREAVARGGYDSIPPRHMTNAALDDLAQRLAERGDEDAQDLLAARGKWRKLASELRRDHGADWRGKLDAAIARERLQQAAANRTPEERAELDAWAAANSIGAGWGEDAED